MATISPEEIRPPRFKFNAQGMTAERVFRLENESDFLPFMEQLLGKFTVASGEVVAGEIGSFPGIPRLLVSEVSVDPFSPDNVTTVDSYGVATSGSGLMVTVSYATRQWDHPPGKLDPGNTTQPPYSDLPGGKKGSKKTSHPAEKKEIIVTHTVDHGGQMLEIPHSSLQWANAHPTTNSKLVNEGVRASVYEGLITDTLTWHRCEKPPWANMRHCKGRVNSQTFLGRRPETVLFLGVSGQREYTVDGVRQWSITYKFLSRQLYYDRVDGTQQTVTWNHFYRHEWNSAWGNTTSPWQRLEEKGRAGRNPFQTADFMTKLFSPEQLADLDNSNEVND